MCRLARWQAIEVDGGWRAWRTRIITAIGNGGELHQLAGGTHPQMTTSTGAVVGDDENSLKIGERGPLLQEDHSAP